MHNSSVLAPTCGAPTRLHHRRLVRRQHRARHTFCPVGVGATPDETTVKRTDRAAQLEERL